MEQNPYVTDNQNYIENSRGRVLLEYYPAQSDDIRLTMCGVENCIPDKEAWDCARVGWHLHVILAGEGVFEIGGVRRTLHAGQMFMLKPGIRFRYHPNPANPWSYCWIVFDGNRAAEYAEAAGFTSNVYVLDSRVDPSRFYRICERILNSPQLNGFSALRRLGLTLEYLSLAMESASINEKHAGKKHMPLYQKSEYVRHAVDYIRYNYSGINVSDISKYLGIDRSYFSFIFKQEMGISPNEYLLQVRMRQASRMLVSPTMSVQDISRYVGYEDSLTFSKAFKRFFGISPKFYREMPAEARPDIEAIIARRAGPAATQE